MGESTAKQDIFPLTEIATLNQVCENLHRQIPRVGQMPPRPPTLRGRFGALLVSLVRRSLFWYIDQHKEFEHQVLEGFRTTNALFQHLDANRQRTQLMLLELQSEIVTLRAAITRLKQEVGTGEPEIGRLLESVLRAETKARLTLENYVQHELNDVRASVRASKAIPDLSTKQSG